MTEYFLEGGTGRCSRVRITADEFHAIQRAKETLHHFLIITETYRVVVERYRAVEQAKHDAELDHILHSKAVYRSSLDTRVTLNSAVVAYLSSARLFLDSTDKLLPILLDAGSVDAYKQLKRSLYDSGAGYRFVECLRNYIQHKGLPVQLLMYHSFVEDKFDVPNSELVTCLSLKAHRETLRKDKKFKPAALEGLPDTIDIIDCVRLHMEGLWRLHDHIVKRHATAATGARELIEAYIQRFVGETAEKALGLVATAGDLECPEQERVPLFLGWDDARIAVVKELGNLANLHKRYIIEPQKVNVTRSSVEGQCGRFAEALESCGRAFGAF